MNKYKVGDKIVLTVSDVNEKAYYSYYVFNNNDLILWEPSTDKYAEPLSTYTEPLEAKIRRQAAEITRLLAENKRLKKENKTMSVKIDCYELYGDQHEEEYNQAFNQGAEAAWELAKKCMLMTDREREIIFGSGHNALYGVLTYFDYKHAAAKVAEWEKAKEENKVRVGDVLHYKYDKAKCICVTAVESNDNFNGVDKYGNTFLNRCDDVWEKTGRHIDIDGFLKQIGEE